MFQWVKFKDNVWVKFKDNVWEVVKVGRDSVIRTGLLSFVDKLLVIRVGPSCKHAY